MTIGNHLAGVLMALGAGASAQVAADDPASVVSALQDAGYRATLGTDGQGDPKVESAVSRTEFTVYFYGCDGGNAGCDALLFAAGYDLADSLSALRVNEWNRTKLAGRAYIDDEGDPFLELYVNLAGGVPSANFAATLDVWSRTVGEFEDFIDW